MYTINGIHLLQQAPDTWLKKLNPQVLIYACAWENQAPETLDKFRNYAAHLVQLLPNAVIGVRWWPDDNILERFTPKQYADNFFRLHVPGTILMVGNEDNPADYTKTVKLHVELMKLATAQNIPIGTCCTSMGNPRPDKYPQIQPLFDEMAVARKKGIIHWWRPNTYSPIPLNNELIQQHIKEAKKLNNYPPTFYGEFNFIHSLNEAENGPLGFGMSPTDWEKNLKDSQLPVPTALYCYGDGIYDTRWKWFNVARDQGYLDVMTDSLPRSKYTAYEEWKLNNTKTDFKCSVKKKVFQNIKLRQDHSLSADLVNKRILQAGEIVNVYTDSMVNQDTYWWQRVVCSDGTIGWSAMAVLNVPSFIDVC